MEDFSPFSPDLSDPEPTPKAKSTLSMSGAGFFGAQPKTRFN
jgi:hypothetical protein